MGTRSTAARPRDLRRVHDELERWRRKRRPGGRIPEALWSAAVGLAHEHGVNKIARALGLNYYSLRDRVEAEPGDVKATGADSPFVEVPLHAVAGSAAASCVVEVEDRRGRRLRLELRGLAGDELAGLIRSVWSEPAR